MKTVRTLPLLLLTGLALLGCASEDSGSFQGYVDGDLSFVASPFAGTLEQLAVQEGELVQAKQELFALELEPQNSQLKQAEFQLQSAQKTLDNLSKGQRQSIISGIEAEIDRAMADVDLARVRMERAKILFEKKLSGKDTYDAAQTDFKTKEDLLNQQKAKLKEATLGSREDVVAAQEALVQGAESKVTELQWALSSKRLFAPKEAYVLDVFYHQGEYVPASKPVVSLLIPDNQFIIFFIPLEVIHSVQKGDSVLVSCEGCGANYKAIIQYISPKVEFTPPVIFSREQHHKYVYKLHAKLATEDIKKLHMGQPVQVSLMKRR